MPYNVPQTDRHGYFDSSHFPVFDASEKVVGGMAIIRDTTARVWSGAMPAWIENVTKDTNFPRLNVAAKEGLCSAFAFPIISGKEVLGVVEFLSHEIQTPDNDLLNMLGATGKQIGQFINDTLGHNANKCGCRIFNIN